MPSRKIACLYGVLTGLLVLAGVPAAAQAPSGNPGDLVLADDFELGRFDPKGGLFYKQNAEQRAGKVVFQSRNVRAGRSALTLVLPPSCKPGARNCSERAEVWEKPEVLAPYDKTVWYGFSMLMEDPVPQDDGRYVMAQWKREIMSGAEGDYSPFLALRLYQGKLGFTVETDLIPSFPIGSAQRPNGCLPGEARVLSRPGAARQTRALVAMEANTTPANYPAYFNACAPGIRVTRHADLPSAQKGWIDFVIRSQPGPTGNGHVEIVADGVAIATVKGHIGHAGPGLGRNQYFKFGPYRAPHPQDWTLSFDSFRRGPRCTDVTDAAHCPAS